MAKQEGIRLTFSKKNSDVQRLIEKKKEEAKEVGRNFIATDYICEAIRFYEKNRTNEKININMVERLIDKKISSLKEELLKSEIQLSKSEESKIKNLAHLEESIEDISLEDD